MVAGATLGVHLEVLLAAGCMRMDLAAVSNEDKENADCKARTCLKLKFIQVGRVGCVIWQSGY